MTTIKHKASPAQAKPASRVVSYLRVDSRFPDDQAEAVTVQRTACRRIAAEHGATIAIEFCDVGASGTSRERDGLSALLRAITCEPVDVVVCADRDRLARDHRLFTELTNTLASYGVTLLTGDEAETDESGEELQRIAESAVWIWEHGVGVPAGDLPVAQANSVTDVAEGRPHD